MSFTFSRTFLLRDGFGYRIVDSMSECPSHCSTVCRSTPAHRQRVANFEQNLCRSGYPRADLTVRRHLDLRRPDLRSFRTACTIRQMIAARSHNAISKRKVFARLSITTGNLLQALGILLAGFAITISRSTRSTRVAVTAMVVSWILLYFSSHAIAHWLFGRAVGIRFLFYTVGGTGNPEGWPVGLRWVFEHLPFFGVQTEKLSLERVSPQATALMWSAGVTSSAVIPTLSAFLAWRFGVSWSRWFFPFALFWALGTLASNWTSGTGDYAKARRALR
jgi:hypothetical protein